MPELKIGRVSLNPGRSRRRIYPFTNTEGLVLASKKAGAEEALARLRVKVARMTDEDGFPAVTIVLDDILALIDEEMRDA